jgi:serine phosphatase RsbU (regulator of sigma subunit)
MRRLLRVGRWILLLAELLPFGIYPRDLVVSPTWRAMLAVVVLYNAAAVRFVREERLGGPPVLLLLVLDLLVIAALVQMTGGIHSDFLGLYYLVIIAAAIFHELPGGLSAALSASVLLLLAEGGAGRLHLTWSGGLRIAAWVSELLMAGLVPGYLMREIGRQLRARDADLAALHELQVRDRLRQQEMAIARQIQTASLPTELPRPEGWECAARFLPFREVGGDVYDLFLCERCLKLLVGDVSGKGIPAALLAMRVSSLFRTLPLDMPCDQVLTAMNRQLAGTIPDGVYATALVGTVDVATGAYELACAGHPPALALGDGLTELGSGSLPLGLFADSTYSCQRGLLAPGELLLLYTDGVTDVVGPGGKRWGESRLTALLRQSVNQGADAVAERIDAAVHEHGSITDDVTIVVVRRVKESA